jgi:hypothetical protein
MARRRSAARPVLDRRSTRSLVLAVLLSLAAVLSALATPASAETESAGPAAHHIVLSLPDTSVAPDTVGRDVGAEATRDARRGPPPHVARDLPGERHATHLSHAILPAVPDPRLAWARHRAVSSPPQGTDHRRYARRPPGRAPPSPQDT